MNFSRLTEEEATILASAGKVLRNYVFEPSFETLISRTCDLLERLGDSELKVSLFIFIKKAIRYFDLAALERYTFLEPISFDPSTQKKVVSTVSEKF